jgi:two-component system, response regulator PdtaR
MNRRILIVEDESIVADDLAWQLTQIGYEIVGIAASGEEALSLADQERPDIVIMDIQLQGPMLGTEAAQLIQQKTGAAIIFLTAFAAVFIRDPSQMRSPGICLSKPFSTVQLKAALQSVPTKAGR